MAGGWLPAVSRRSHASEPRIHSVLARGDWVFCAGVAGHLGGCNDGGGAMSEVTELLDKLDRQATRLLCALTDRRPFQLIGGPFAYLRQVAVSVWWAVR